MRHLLFIILLFFVSAAYGQVIPPWTKGPYVIGQKVTSDSSIYQSLRNFTSGTPPKANTYWKNLGRNPSYIRPISEIDRMWTKISQLEKYMLGAFKSDTILVEQVLVDTAKGIIIYTRRR